MRTRLSIVWGFVLLCVLCTPAFAAGPIASVLQDAIGIAAGGLLIAITGLITIGLQRLAAKWKVQIPAVWMQSANAWVDKGIHYAEEWAKNHAAEVSGPDKLEAAVGFVLKFTDDKKLKEMTAEKLKAFIEARLAELRGDVNVTTIK